MVARRDHWEHVFGTRAATELSWYQAEAAQSLALIRRFAFDLDSPIIDVGAGQSPLVDGLLDAGYRRVTVLDIAGSALATVRQRLGDRASRVEWIESDVVEARLPPASYAVWHDRAAFHFLTDAADRARYIALMKASVRDGGHVIIATFLPEGPERCSGLDVVRYSPTALARELGSGLELEDSVREEHRTPGGTPQAFAYTVLRLRRGRPPGS